MVRQALPSTMVHWRISGRWGSEENRLRVLEQVARGEMR